MLLGWSECFDLAVAGLRRAAALLSASAGARTGRSSVVTMRALFVDR
jgi:hypothetical protein